MFMNANKSVLVTHIAQITIVLASLSTLIAFNNSGSSNNNNQFLLQKALAQPSSNVTSPMNNDTAATTNISAVSHDDLSKHEEILFRGIVSSEPSPEPSAIDHDRAVILPHREDGASYAGTLTFTATKPVAVILGHRLPIDNATYSQIDPQTFGELYRFHTMAPPHALGITATPTIILPDYGSSPPYYSATIPFVASSVVLGSIQEGPFIAVYEVFADSGQPKIVSNIESAITNNNTTAVTIDNITNTGVP